MPELGEEQKLKGGVTLGVLSVNWDSCRYFSRSHDNHAR